MHISTPMLLLAILIIGCASQGCSQVKCRPKVVNMGHTLVDFMHYPASSEEKCERFLHPFITHGRYTLHAYFKWKHPEKVSDVFIRVYIINSEITFEQFFPGTPTKEMYFSIPVDAGLCSVEIGSKKGQSIVSSYFWAELDQYREYTELIRAALKAALNSPPVTTMKKLLPTPLMLLYGYSTQGCSHIMLT